jgi:hypothetical protein
MEMLFTLEHTFLLLLAYTFILHFHGKMEDCLISLHKKLHLMTIHQQVVAYIYVPSKFKVQNSKASHNWFSKDVNFHHKNWISQNQQVLHFHYYLIKYLPV